MQAKRQSVKIIFYFDEANSMYIGESILRHSLGYKKIQAIRPKFILVHSTF